MQELNELIIDKLTLEIMRRNPETLEPRRTARQLLQALGDPGQVIRALDAPIEPVNLFINYQAENR